MCSLGAPPAGCSPAARARRRRDRVEKCYLLRAACAVLLDELTHGCYICGCWRKSGAACCRLSGQTPRTSSGCERGEARGEEDDGRDEEGDGGRGGVPQQKSRSAAACSITTDALPCRFRALPLDAVRLDVTREHRALDKMLARRRDGTHFEPATVRAWRQLARRPALIPWSGGSRTASESRAYASECGCRRTASSLQRAKQRFRSLCRACAHRTGCSGVRMLHQRRAARTDK